MAGLAINRSVYSDRASLRVPQSGYFYRFNFTAIDLVSFAFVNTLMVHRFIPGKQYSLVAGKHGLDCDPEEMQKAYKKNWEDMTINYPNFGMYHKSKFKDWRDWSKQLINKTFYGDNEDLNYTLIDNISEELIEGYSKVGYWRYCKGVVSLLKYLQSKNVTLIVTSNFDPRLKDILKRAELDIYFKEIQSSYEVGYYKPQAEIFIGSRNRLIGPTRWKGRLLHIGNRPNEDYFSPNSAGWHAFLVGYERRKVSLIKVWRKDLFKNLRNVKRAFQIGYGDLVYIKKNFTATPPTRSFAKPFANYSKPTGEKNSTS